MSKHLTHTKDLSKDEILQIFSYSMFFFLDSFL
jgi:hypothetical protein